MTHFLTCLRIYQKQTFWPSFMIIRLKMWPLERTQGKKLTTDDAWRTQHYHNSSLRAKNTGSPGKGLILYHTILSFKDPEMDSLLAFPPFPRMFSTLSKKSSFQQIKICLLQIYAFILNHYKILLFGTDQLVQNVDLLILSKWGLINLGKKKSP